MLRKCRKCGTFIDTGECGIRYAKVFIEVESDER